MTRSRTIRPRSIITRASVFLLLVIGGAVVNVAVEWSLALMTHPSWPELKMQGWFHCEADGRLWMVHLLQQSGSAELFSTAMFADWFEDSLLTKLRAGEEIMGKRMVTLDSIPSWSCFHEPPGSVHREDVYAVRHERAYGWPLLAMQYRAESDLKRSSRVMQALRVKAEALPVGILWPGFAINTLFYAAILWLLFAAPGALRRRRRIRRGLCPACAYPVGASNVCTECGKPVTVRSAESAST